MTLCVRLYLTSVLKVLYNGCSTNAAFNPVALNASEFEQVRFLKIPLKTDAGFGW